MMKNTLKMNKVSYWIYFMQNIWIYSNSIAFKTKTLYNYRLQVLGEFYNTKFTN